MEENKRFEHYIQYDIDITNLTQSQLKQFEGELRKLCSKFEIAYRDSDED